VTADFSADQWLPLSGIQHFVFCRRQWALIHVERVWQENALTAEGRILHDQADDPFFTEKRKDVIIARAVPVSSAALGLSGVCDVVEFTRLGNDEPGGVTLPGRSGQWQPAPVEYKRGRPKRDPCDEAQLCAQALCLEEMLACAIPRGYLYYGQTRHRTPVELDDGLRDLVHKAAREMHGYFERGYTPRVKPSKACDSCSLADACLPALLERSPSVARYIKAELERE
jgi:CRISPR-associated exonuclease Cas4